METTVTTVPSARIRTPEVASRIGATVRVAGWLHSLRRLGGVSFLVVRDGWGVVQAVVEHEAELEPIRAAGAGVESVIAVSGRVAAARARAAPRSSSRRARRSAAPCRGSRRRTG